MGKLGCACGHVIVDQTDNIAYKAEFYKDQDLDYYYKYAEDIVSFIEATKQGKRNEWIESYFVEGYSASLDNKVIIFDIISRYDIKYGSTIYQCENCGRVYIQNKDENRYACFKPESGNCKNIFQGE